MLPFSANSANSSSPDSTPRLSMSSAVMTVTGSAPVIFAPLICEPTTTTSSTSESPDSSESCAYTRNGSNMINEYKYLDSKFNF